MNEEHPEVPQGFYCYTVVNIEYEDVIDPAATALAQAFGETEPQKAMKKINIKICPHWGKDRSRPDQESGYCTLTGHKDWIDGGLLWDQVKECDINRDWDDA